MKRTSYVRTVLAMSIGLLVASAGFAPPTAQAEVSGPAGKLPGDANAIMTVDVARLVASPWGKQHNLREKLMSGYAGRPLPVPANAKHAAVGARLNPVGLESVWQTAVIELPGTPRLEPMIKAQGGYLDEVGGKTAAWTPHDVFYVVLDANTLGVVRPGSRQIVASWAASKAGADAASSSPYLAKALSGSGTGAEAPVAVFAFDLKNAVGPNAIGYALSMGELPALEDIDKGMNELVTALASLAGTTISVRATDRLSAEWVIDFDKDVSALGGKANALVMDALKSAGAHDDDAEKWNFKAEGKRIVGTRDIDADGFGKLVAMLTPAAAGEASSDDGPGGEAQTAGARDNGGDAGPKPAGPNAKASQAYYLAVAKKIDALGPKPSPTSGAAALRSMSTQIQQLPVLGVDPALLEWSASVCDAFTRAGQELAIGQQRAQAASAGVSSPTAGYGYYSNSASTPESRAAFRNAANQRRQVSQNERAAAADRAATILNQVAPGRAKVRAEMTQKYNVEF